MTMHAIEDMPHTFSPTSGQPLYAAWQLKAAYAAGMERAAEIAVGHYTVWDEGVTAGNEIADAIRDEIKEQS